MSQVSTKSVYKQGCFIVTLEFTGVVSLATKAKNRYFSEKRYGLCFSVGLCKNFF